MCIFSQPVVSVNNTQIFARATSQRTQFLAYQMHYESRVVNAMILPLPVRQPARDASLRFVDLGDYNSFFDDLAAGFPYTAPMFNMGCAAAFNAADGHALKMYEVGNYVASFVPTLADFSRLDAQFTLPANIWSKIPQYATYGFAVFQLGSGALTPHPMAFEFECGDDSIYLPTMHIHDGQVHETEEFDHVLYMQHAGFDSQVHGYRNAEVADESTGLVRSKYAAKHFCDVKRSNGVVDADLLVHKKLIRGINPNCDTEIVTSGDPSRPTLNLRPLMSYTPFLVVGAAVSWFFARRARIKQAKSANKANDVSR